MSALAPEPGVLQLRAGYQVVPLSDSEVWLYRRRAPSLHLNTPDADIVSIVAYLSRGADWRTLKDAPEAKTAGWLEAAADLVAMLAEKGALVRPAEAAAAMTEAEHDRFAKQLDYFSRFEEPGRSRFDCLDRLRRSHVLALGLGSLGSSTVQHLVAAGVGRITGVDMDTVENHNRTRAVVYGQADVGLTKVEAIARLVERQSEHTRYDGVNRQISGPGDVKDLLSARAPVDLVLLTADMPSWRIAGWVAEACRACATPMIRGNRLGLGPLTLPDQTACPFCEWPGVLDRFPDAEALIERLRRVQAPGGGVLSPVIGMAAAILSQEIISFLSGAGPIRTVNARLCFELDEGVDFRRCEFPRDVRCPVCGPGATPVGEARHG